MEASFLNRLKHAWNVFINKDPTNFYDTIGPSNSRNPSRHRLSYGTEKSIVSSIYTRIAMDVSCIPLRHVRLDQNGNYFETIDSGINNCLSLDANIDQTGRAFIQDTVLSLFDEGVVCIVPVDTTINPSLSGSFDIQSMRVGKILEWFPYHIRVDLYNERKGQHEQIILPKREVVIIENPLYPIMNEPNSTLKRLVRKLNLLDAIDEQSGSGKLDLIFQLPYVVKTSTKAAEAEARRKSIEDQLSGSKYGIAYIDATERVTQLNRPAENNLMSQIEFLTKMLDSQLGMTEAIRTGTADEKEMINYYNRSILPVCFAISDGMKRRFLTKTARTQGQSIEFLRDPFSLVPVSELATVADSFTRNAILSSNEVRSIIGYKPSDDPEADKLRNKNLNPPSSETVQEINRKSINDDAKVIEKESLNNER